MRSVPFSVLVFNMNLTFEMKTFCVENKFLYQKAMTYKLSENVNFENGGTGIQMGILHERLNILSISLLGTRNIRSIYFVIQKE